MLNIRDISPILQGIIYFLMAFSIFGLIISELSQTVIFMQISVFLISILIGLECADWAKQMDASPNIAFAIGVFLGIFGLIFYALYYEVNTILRFLFKKKVKKGE